MSYLDIAFYYVIARHITISSIEKLVLSQRRMSNQSIEIAMSEVVTDLQTLSCHYPASPVVSSSLRHPLVYCRAGIIVH